MAGKTRNQLTEEFRGYNPYTKDIPILIRPRNDMTCPKSREEKLYCWFFWIEKILDPNQTGYVLETLIRLPEFQAEWGSDWTYSHKLEVKTETFINEDEYL